MPLFSAMASTTVNDNGGTLPHEKANTTDEVSPGLQLPVAREESDNVMMAISDTEVISDEEMSDDGKGGVHFMEIFSPPRVQNYLVPGLISCGAFDILGGYDFCHLTMQRFLFFAFKSCSYYYWNDPEPITMANGQVNGQRGLKFGPSTIVKSHYL